MRTFEVTAPNGKIYEVSGPDGSTKEQALAQVLAVLGVKQKELSPLQTYAMGAYNTVQGALPIMDELGGLGGGLKSLAQGGDFSSGYDQYQKYYSGKEKQFEEENPTAAVLTNLAGMIGAGGLGAAGVNAAAKGTGYLAKLAQMGVRGAETSPYITGATVGAPVGAVTGALGADDNRGEAALMGGLFGGAGGAVATAIINKLVSPAINGAASALAKVRGAKPEVAPVQVATGFGGVSGVPTEQIAPLDVVSNIATDAGGVIRLPKGVRENDIGALRVQEQARQGGLGDAAEASIRGIDKAVIDDTKGVVQSLVGKETTANPDDLLARGIGAYKKRAEAVKKTAGKMMQDRNDKLSKASIYADYTRDTLGRKVASVADDPQNSVFFETSDAAPIVERMKLLNKYIGGEDAPAPKATVDPFTGKKTEAPTPPKKAVDFAKLQGWSSEMSALARANAGKPIGVVANKMVGQYNDWLDNITREAFKEGDDDIVKTIMDTNKNYAMFKKKYGTNKYGGRSNVVNDILQKDELTPEQLVNMVFGSGTKGKTDTGQILDRMVDNMPAGPRRDAMVNDMRSGLIMRAFKKAETQDGSIKMQTLANEITNLLNNPAYKRNLSSVDHDKTMKALAADINRYQRAVNNPTVRSTSGTGGVMTRMWNGVANVMQSAPMHYTTGGTSQILADIATKAANAGSKAELRGIEKEFFKEMQRAISSKTTIYGNVVGGEVGGKTSAEDNK